MGIPAYPRLTGDKERDSELLQSYKRLCLENIKPGDLPHLAPNFPADHLPEFKSPGHVVILPKAEEAPPVEEADEEEED